MPNESKYQEYAYKKQSKKVHYTYILKKDSVFQKNLILPEMCDVEIIYLIRFIFPLTHCLEKVKKKKKKATHGFGLASVVS